MEFAVDDLIKSEAKKVEEANQKREIEDEKRRQNHAAIVERSHRDRLATEHNHHRARNHVASEHSSRRATDEWNAARRGSASSGRLVNDDDRHGRTSAQSRYGKERDHESPDQQSEINESVNGDRDGERSSRSNNDKKHDNDADSANGSTRGISERSRSPHRQRSRQRHRERSRDGRRENDNHYRPSSGRSRNDSDRHGGEDRRHRGGRDGRDTRDTRDTRDGRDQRSDERNPRGGRPYGDYGRDADRDRSGRTDNRRGQDHRQDNVQRQNVPAPTDEERDKRTVFVQQLANALRSRELKEFFEKIGPVREVQIVRDRTSGRSKGVGYVEFENEESVEKARQLTGRKLRDVPIIVELTDAEKNRQARATPHSSLSNGKPFHRLYVGNIHFSVGEEDIRPIFEAFGPLEFIQLQKEESGRSKGYGFVQYTDSANAQDALSQLQSFEIAGRQIRVGLGSDRHIVDSEAQTMQQRLERPPQGSSFSGLGGRGQHAGGAGNFDRAGGRDADKAGGASALDDNDVAGVSFSNVSREQLMRKLARLDEPDKKSATVKKQVKAPVEAAVPTRCVCLTNMWTVQSTYEAEWQKELEEDVTAECNESYGTVRHVGIDKMSNPGEVYVKFEAIEGGQKAYRGLNGRYFNGNTITASFVVDAVYNVIFPKAASL